jgi:hypothetical protein
MGLQPGPRSSSTQWSPLVVLIYPCPQAQPGPQPQPPEGAARSHCTSFMAHYNTGDLAMPTSLVRNQASGVGPGHVSTNPCTAVLAPFVLPESPHLREAMARVVDETGAPHWIGADNPRHGNHDPYRSPRHPPHCPTPGELPSPPRPYSIDAHDHRETYVHWLNTGATGTGHFHAHKASLAGLGAGLGLGRDRPFPARIPTTPPTAAPKKGRRCPPSHWHHPHRHLVIA